MGRRVNSCFSVESLSTSSDRPRMWTWLRLHILLHSISASDHDCYPILSYPILSFIARPCHSLRPSVRPSVHSRYLGLPGDACRAARRSRRPEPVRDV